VRYGGATPAIRVCRRWLKFGNFLADMGDRPSGTSLGRHGDVGIYKKSNCSWQTRTEQGHHRHLRLVRAARAARAARAVAALAA
jgi:hypothetical protein